MVISVVELGQIDRRYSACNEFWRTRTGLSCDPIVTRRISLKNKKFFYLLSY